MKCKFSETTVGHDSYRETFTSWAVTTIIGERV